MSIDATRWAWQQQIKPASLKLLLLSMADRSNGDDFTCYPSIELIANDTGLNRKTIISGIQRLCELNLIEKTGITKGKTGKVLEYRLVGVVTRDLYQDHHYVYKTTDPLTGEFYIGVRSSVTEPEKDKYFGSGRWVSLHQEPKRLVKEVLHEFNTRKEAEYHESEQINFFINDPLCKNLSTEKYRLNRPKNGTIKTDPKTESLNRTQNGTIKQDLMGNSPENGTLNSPENGTQNLSMEPINNLKEKDKKEKSKTKQFTKPTLDEINQHILEKKYNVNPVLFFNHYESNGWRVGKNPMKSWESALVTWNEKNKGKHYEAHQNTSQAKTAHQQAVSDWLDEIETDYQNEHGHGQDGGDLWQRVDQPAQRQTIEGDYQGDMG